MNDGGPNSTAGRYHPLWHLIVARLREFCREPAAIFWVYVFPLIMIVALGIAFRNRPLERFEVAVPKGPGAESLRSALETDPRFDVEILDADACRRRLRIGLADLVVAAGAQAEGGYDYFFDPTRQSNLLARSAADDVLQRVAGRIDVIPTRGHEIIDPGGRYIDFLVPGLLGMGLMGGGLWGVGFAIVDMRIRKLLKRYLATPMKRSHFLAGIMLSRLVFTVPEVALVLVFARVFFGVVSHGGYLTVGLLILLGAFQFAGIGLLVASRAETLETVSGLMNLVMLPMWIASGIFFPIDRFPQSVQPVIQLLPLTPLIDALRRVMLEGVGLTALGPNLVLIVLWGVVTFVLALRTFRWS
jgi:ABC-type multidrug transport system permease subunit